MLYSSKVQLPLLSDVGTCGLLLIGWFSTLRGSRCARGLSGGKGVCGPSSCCCSSDCVPLSGVLVDEKCLGLHLRTALQGGTQPRALHRPGSTPCGVQSESWKLACRANCWLKARLPAIILVLVVILVKRTARALEFFYFEQMCSSFLARSAASFVQQRFCQQASRATFARAAVPSLGVGSPSSSRPCHKGNPAAGKLGGAGHLPSFKASFAASFMSSTPPQSAPPVSNSSSQQAQNTAGSLTSASGIGEVHWAALTVTCSLSVPCPTLLAPSASRAPTPDGMPKLHATGHAISISCMPKHNQISFFMCLQVSRAKKAHQKRVQRRNALYIPPEALQPRQESQAAPRRPSSSLPGMLPNIC